MANITYDLQVRYAPPELSLSRALLRVEYLTSWPCAAAVARVQYGYPRPPYKATWLRTNAAVCTVTDILDQIEAEDPEDEALRPDVRHASRTDQRLWI